jgi:hypothetical protein
MVWVEPIATTELLSRPNSPYQRELIRTTKVFGTYENTDAITFPNCGALMSSVRNPLTFIIPTNQWSAGVSIKINFCKILTPYWNA